MAKARAILKRRKAVRNIRKITKTMQMIATAKFQKCLKRAVGTKPYTTMVRQLVRDLARSVDSVDHPLLRKVAPETATGKHTVIVIVSNRGLAGAYNGSVLRKASAFIRDLESQGKTVRLHVVGKKAATFFAYQKRTDFVRHEEFGDMPRYAEVDALAEEQMAKFVNGEIDAVHVVYMNFISTAVQRTEVSTVLPLAGVEEAVDELARQLAEKEAQVRAGSMDTDRTGEDVQAAAHHYDTQTTYDFSPSAKDLLDELLPLTVKTALFQTFLDSVTSENVARMVAMKSATDNADKMQKTLAMQYNRARQSQITTELSEIMGGVEAMK